MKNESYRLKGHIGLTDNGFCIVCAELEKLEWTIGEYKKIQWFKLPHRSKAWVKDRLINQNQNAAQHLQDHLAQYIQIKDSHIRCANCTILLGTGHIEWDIFSHKNKPYCASCLERVKAKREGIA